MEQTTATKEEPKIRDRGYALRLTQACDAHFSCPAGYGRLSWVAQELNGRMGTNTSAQTVSRWFAGQVKPRKETSDVLAKMLGVDATWLYLGIETNSSARSRGPAAMQIPPVAHVVAGLIGMEGGSVAIPAANDKRALQDNVNLFAVINATNYAFHITEGKTAGKEQTFNVPANFDNATVLGVVRDGFSVRIFELTAATIRSNSKRDGDNLIVTLAPSAADEVTSFDDF